MIGVSSNTHAYGCIMHSIYKATQQAQPVTRILVIYFMNFTFIFLILFFTYIFILASFNLYLSKSDHVESPILTRQWAKESYIALTLAQCLSLNFTPPYIHKIVFGEGNRLRSNRGHGHGHCIYGLQCKNDIGLFS